MSPSAVPEHPNLIVVRFGEIFLKGGNRRFFIDGLRSRLSKAARGSGWKVQSTHGRFLLRPKAGQADGPPPVEAVLPALCRVFGVVSVSPAIETSVELDEVAQVAASMAARDVPAGANSYRIRSRRSDKSLPFTSVQANEAIAMKVHPVLDLAVNLKFADFEVGVELGNTSFVFTKTLPGPGGLPVGVSGRVLLLLSGGIDSPVAGYLAMKRGCVLEAVYFHSFPLVGDGAKDKVLDLAEVLAAYGDKIRVHVVPFAEAQKACRDQAHPRLLVLLYRRLMFRIAQRIAQDNGARALVTGESLGQVASQTLENLDCIGAVVDMPILRPLITMDKADTIQLARRIGSFDISILPHEDCCSLFVPKHPETRGRREVIESNEARLDMDGLVEAALAHVEVLTIG